MALKTDRAQPIYERAGLANRWQIVSTDIRTPDDGDNAIVVTCVPYHIGDDGSTRLGVGKPVVTTYVGERLNQVMADAAGRAAAAGKKGNPGGLALYLGIRDALYAALQQDGVIPQTAS